MTCQAEIELLQTPASLIEPCVVVRGEQGRMHEAERIGRRRLIAVAQGGAVKSVLTQVRKKRAVV